MKKVAKALGTLGLVGCAVIVSPYAVAEDSGWYVGGNIGQSRAKIDDPRIISGLLGGGFTTTSIADDNNDTGYKLFGGYKLNKNFALEAGYFNLGKFSFTAATIPAGTLKGSTKLDGLNLDVVGILPVTEKFSAFGRVGMNYAEAKDTFAGTGLVSVLNPSPSKRDLNPKVGLGVQYDFTESLGMRVEAERYRINDAVGNKGDIDVVSLGLVYHFGMDKPVPAPVPKAAAPEPVPVEAAIAPPPVVVTPPPPPPPPAPIKRVFTADSSAGSFFEFNKAIVTPVGQEALHKFAVELSGANYEVIMVTGHTDRIGSRAYNTRLSERRAEAVKTYLVESSGISADKITTKGVGEAQPVTKPSECKGKKTRKLIACLAPDRRVEVEVAATRTSK